VPASQQQMGDEGQREENRDAAHREQQQRRKHARNIEAIAGFDDAVGEPRAGAGGSGCNLGNHRADQGEAAGDLETGKDVGQCARQLELGEDLHAPCSVQAEKIGEIAIDRVEPERRIGEHGEEGDDPRAGKDRRLLRQIDQQERRNRHDRRHLQDHGIGIKRIFDQARLIEDDGEPYAAERREQKALERGRERDHERGEEHRPIRDEGGENKQRSRQHVGRQVVKAHDQVPQRHAGCEHDDGEQDAQPALLARRRVVARAAQVHGFPVIARAKASETCRQKAA
jgi:hypothetical protein